MSFDYRELMTQVFADQEKEQPCGEQTDDRKLGCQLCSTTAAPGCQQCQTTIPGCGVCQTTNVEDQPCSKTKKHADGSWSQYAQDLAVLHQQLRDSLAAG